MSTRTHWWVVSDEWPIPKAARCLQDMLESRSTVVGLMQLVMVHNTRLYHRQAVEQCLKELYDLQCANSVPTVFVVLACLNNNGTGICIPPADERSAAEEKLYQIQLQHFR